MDEFLGTYKVGEARYKDLWQVCKFVFILSHGQAPVEGGFNINKDTEVENLHEDSLVQLQPVYEEISARGDDIATMEISPELSLFPVSKHLLGTRSILRRRMRMYKRKQFVKSENYSRKSMLM